MLLFRDWQTGAALAALTIALFYLCFSDAAIRQAQTIADSSDPALVIAALQ